MISDHAEQPEYASGNAEPRRLSVVQVVRSDAFAGVERYICQVANGLTSRGHHVVVIGGDPARMQSELSGRVRHHRATSVGQAAWTLMSQRHADVVHAHMTAAEGAAWLARPLQRAPIVATRHFPGDRGTGSVARVLARITTPALSRDIAISSYVAQSIEKPTVLLLNGVSNRPQAALESSTVLMLQRLTVEKAPELGIRAWSASELGTHGWSLVIAGTGQLKSSLIELAHDLEIADSVEFVGQIADTDRLLSESSVVLAPAPEEPFGLSVVEAMAHGIPVIAANGGAHVETVADDGMLFPPGDAHAAASALVMLCNDEGLRRRIGARLRDRQQRMFSLPEHLDQLEIIYRQVIDENGRR